MKESFLHLVWEQKLLISKELKTVEGVVLKIFNNGILNTLQGPDFSNGLIALGGQKWAGNIEIHVKASDWYAHKHELDENYTNVILHVVYDYDIDVYDCNGNTIPTLELKNYIKPGVLNNYKELMSNDKKWIFCEDVFATMDSFMFKMWLEQLYIERLERKVLELDLLYNRLEKDWEATLFYALAKYFGGNLNGDAFVDAFKLVDYSIIRKQFVNKTSTSLLFGLLGLLEDEDIEDAYYLKLKREFHYQKQKYSIGVLSAQKLNFYGCRPFNFPTIRLVQLVMLYETKHALFKELMAIKGNEEGYLNLFKGAVSDYWQYHHHFGKESKKSLKKISASFVNIILINVVVPLQFLYAKKKEEDVGHLLELMYRLSPEKNNIVSKYQKIGFRSTSALETQALLTLKKDYCEKEFCDKCNLGLFVLCNC